MALIDFKWIMGLDCLSTCLEPNNVAQTGLSVQARAVKSQNLTARNGVRRAV